MNRLILKLLGRPPLKTYEDKTKNQIEEKKNEYYYLKDIYFVLDFRNQDIIPIVFNENYTSLQRLDNMQILKLQKLRKNKLDNFENTPSFLIKATISNYADVMYNSEYYHINHIAIKMLFANLSNSFSVLNDIQILDSFYFNSKYNLVRKFSNLRNRFNDKYDLIVSTMDLDKAIKYVKNTRRFKHEVEEVDHIKSTEKSRIF